MNWTGLWIHSGIQCLVLTSQSIMTLIYLSLEIPTASYKLDRRDLNDVKVKNSLCHPLPLYLTIIPWCTCSTIKCIDDFIPRSRFSIVYQSTTIQANIASCRSCRSSSGHAHVPKAKIIIDAKKTIYTFHCPSRHAMGPLKSKYHRKNQPNRRLPAWAKINCQMSNHCCCL